MESVFDWSVILGIVGVLVALTNIITQVLKRVTWGKLPTNILAVIVSMVLTLAALFAYCQIKAVAITWYSVVAFVVVGFMVAYAAMFGFDKLKETLSQSGAETTTDTGENTAGTVVDSARVEEIGSLVGMSLTELKEKAAEYGVSTDGLTLKKEIAAAVIPAILGQTKAEQDEPGGGKEDNEDE